MRWFWILIVLLALLTAGLFVRRVRSSAIPEPVPTEPITIQPAAEPESSTAEHHTEHQAQAQAETEPEPQSRSADSPETDKPSADVPEQPRAEDEEESQDQLADDPDPAAAELIDDQAEHEPDLSEPESDPEPARDPIPDPVPTSAPEQHQSIDTETDDATQETQATDQQQQPAEMDKPEVLPGLEEGLDTSRKTGQEAAAESDPAPAQEPVPEPAPEFERLPDGSIRVLATNTIIPGDGSAEHPFVLSWKILASVEKSYVPRKEKSHLPAWLDELNEKHVRIEGNTLVPVVASSTNELVMMQNPWDGCCIGVPPTPYDAIEVTLSHDVDFGNSAVGYGTLEGIFYLDPYVVDGWVLGLYIIEDGVYRSGADVEFPEF